MSPQLRTDADWLAAAARLASRARPSSRPNPGVGAIIVKDDRVVGRGWTQPGGRPHAEAMALAMAGDAARGAALYCTLEPCAHRSERGPSCAASIGEAGVARCVFGTMDPDPRTSGKGLQAMREAGLDAVHQPDDACRESLAGYLILTEHRRPHITLKLAVSLDGCVSLDNGESQWITCEAARAHVHSRRAMADAILVGGGTWRADRPRLDVRLEGLEDRSPQRILLSRGVPPDGVKVINAPDQVSQLDGVQYLYVEGGAQTAAAFLARDLVDRIELYRAPIVIGGRNAIGDIGLTDLASAHDRWTLSERRQLGSDSHEAYSRTR